MENKPKYNIGNIVEFKHKTNIFYGEVVGITEGQFSISYCIYNKINIGNCDTFLMEESDISTFTTYSNEFVSNIGSRAFWKSEEYIIGIKNENNGSKCKRCKEYNQYIDNIDYVCWRCTNYPY